MSKFLPTLLRRTVLKTRQHNQSIQIRHFLSNAYYCNEVWNARLKSPILQKVQLDELYHELDLSYQKNKNISAVDVDLYSNAVKEEGYVDELLDLIHKLRLSADTMNTLESTQHAVVRYLVSQEQYDRLLQVFDDRLNYGIFLDSYTSNLLLDLFWKKKDYSSGARVASQMMLQEDFNHPLNTYLCLLHCYNFLKDPSGWVEEQPAPDDGEEIKVRVKYLRNPYFDNHFDLNNPLKITGKTLHLACTDLEDTLSNTLRIIGSALFQNEDKVKEEVQSMMKKNQTIISEGLTLIPDENPVKSELQKLKTVEENISDLLVSKVKESEKICSERDIAEQCKRFDKWEELRKEALRRQQKRLETAQRLMTIDESQKKLKEKEMKLWFFEREDQLDLDIDAKRVYYYKRWFGKKKKPRKVDENYIPPEVQTKYRKK